MSTPQPMLIQHVKQLVLLGVAGLVFALFAKSKGYFTLPAAEKRFSLLFRYLLIGFLIYFVVSFLISPLLSLIVFHQSSIKGMSNDELNISKIFFVNTFITCLTAVGLLIHLVKLPLGIRQEIIKSPFSKSSYLTDIGMGLLSWVIAFPITLFVSQLVEVIVKYVFNITRLPDQIAVYYLKKTMDYPIIFAVTIIVIAILAPLIEEYLFRGLLQNFLRSKIGRKAAILLTALIFSLFHFSLHQKISNIVIIFSLFVLALFLGFIYEKQRSLVSACVLHIAFNSFSILSVSIFQTGG